MVEKITKEEMDMIKKHREEENHIEVDIEKEPEVFETENLATVIEEEDTKDCYTCSECGFDKITKDMKSCPKCKSDLKW